MRIFTEEGRIAAESLVEDKRFRVAASALLKKFSAIVADESFESAIASFVDKTPGAAEVEAAEDIEDAEDTEDKEDAGESEDTEVAKDNSGSSSPDLRSSPSKRLKSSALVSISYSDQDIVRLGVELTFSVKDLGIREVPSQVEPIDSLLALLSDSPHERMLSRTNWIEFPRCQRLPLAWDNLLFGCWIDQPVLNYATAVLFAGCVLFNSASGHAALCMVVESYGRGLDIDVHAEKPICNGQSVSTSQPSTSGLYPHAMVCHLQNDKNDQRLVVGCKYFNILVTEIWRVDKDCPSDRAFVAGSCCSAFPIVGNEQVRIFVDKRSFDLASDIASGQYIPRFEIDHLRQIHSNLCSEHSYRMGRASSHFISDMASAQVASIFSLSVISPECTDGSLVSSLLRRIAKDVNAKGRDALLQKAVLFEVLGKVRTGQSTDRFLRLILNLFDDRSEINIFGENSPARLEELLCELANGISTALYDCNETVVIPNLRQEIHRLSR
ncbi:hypothetical protein BG004_005790 [Podila humilis]|nr:hypothetical protein BG004_005790 [Podila humilis]